MGCSNSSVGEGEREAEVLEDLRHAERADEHGAHRRKDHQSCRALLRVDDAGEPGVGDPRPPQDAQHDQPFGETLPRRLGGHECRALRDGQHEHQVEEQLERSDPLLLPPNGVHAVTAALAVRHLDRVGQVCQDPSAQVGVSVHLDRTSFLGALTATRSAAEGDGWQAHGHVSALVE